MSEPLRVFVIAGELSGDKLGAAMMQGLDELTAGQVSFQGVGGPRMEAQGLDSLFPMDEISIMGITEILSQYSNLKARIRETADAVIAARPDVLISIDLPEFSLRVARLVKAASDIRTVHYVAPTVWAWRPGRAAKMARHIDQVLALFPFEPPYMEAAGMRCDFVGHPVVTDPVATPDEITGFRNCFDIQGDYLLILPGSRRSEVSRLAPIFGQVLARVLDKRPGLRPVIPAAAPVADAVMQAAGSWPGNPVVLDPRSHPDPALKRGAFAGARAALAASGTVSLELAAAGTPMVVAYDMNWVSRQVISRMLRVDTVTLVNLVTNSRSVPEFIGKACQPDRVAQSVLDVLSHPEAQKAAMSETMQKLGKDGPSPGLRAAKAVLDGIAEATRAKR